MAAAWEDFGAPDSSTKTASPPQWEEFGAPQAAIPLADDGKPTGYADGDIKVTNRKPKDLASSNILDLWNHDALTGEERQWGLSPESQKELGIFGAKYGPADVGARILTGMQALTEMGAAGVEKAWQGMTPEGPTGDLTRSIHPGEAILALAEAMPDAGLSHGIVGPHRFSPQTEAELQSLFKNGSAEQILDEVKQVGGHIDPDAVSEFVKKRDAGAPIDPRVRYEQGNLPLEEQHSLQLNNPPSPESKLSAEAEAFTKGKSAEPDLDYRQRELPLDRPPQQLGLDLPEPEAKAASEPAPEYKTPENVQGIVDHVNETTKDWKNAPEIEVHHNFDDLEDVNPRAMGVYDAETGKIRLNTQAIEDEAKLRDLTPEEMTNTVVFHEGLGHFGLAQKFQDGLDSTLNSFYKDSPMFRRKVDAWLKKNPDDYADDFDRTARAAEEVLAEQSEKGALPVSFSNRLKNYVKASARKMGLKVDYTQREIDTILAQAHENITGGTKSAASGKGMRYSLSPYNEDVKAVARQYGYDGEQLQRALKQVDFRYAVDQARRRRLGLEHDGVTIETPQDDIDWVNRTRELNSAPKTSPFTEVKETKDGTKFLEYKSKSGEVIPIKMAIDNGTAEIAIDQFSTKANRLGPGELRKAMLDLAEKYPEIERFGGYRRSGSGAGRVQELAIKSANRYMMRRMGDSKGPLRGVADEEGNGKALIGAYRTNRNVEDILAENTPEKNPESWGEWIDKAGSLKNPGKIAQNLARGSEVPELTAARQFAVKSMNRIWDLSHKENLSEREMYLLTKEQERLANVMQSIDDVVTNAGRVLNSLKMEVGSDKALTDQMRRMLPHADLTTPEGRQAFVDAVAKGKKQQEAVEKNMRMLSNLLNLPRTVMSSIDLSAPFNQGLFLIGTKGFWRSFGTMFKSLKSEDVYQDIMAGIKERPTYELMEKSGLSLTDIDSELTSREEAFQSEWGKKIPGVAMSERGFNGFLNKLRADTFDRLLKQSQDAGVVSTDPKMSLETKLQNEKFIKDIATYVNNATGRGDLGRFSQSGPWLSGLFFSPRLLASRVNLLTQWMRPSTYTTLNPVVRAEYMKNFATMGGMALTVAGIAKMMGAEVSTDPKSSDFMKVKVGNTRYGTLGSFDPLIVLSARLVANAKTNSKGKVVEYGKGFKAETAYDALATFVRTKLAPVPGTAIDLRVGKNVVGQPVTATSAIGSFAPMFLQDFYDVWKDQKKDFGKAAEMSVPGLFGVPMQTYDANAPKTPKKAAEPQPEAATTQAETPSWEEFK